MGKRLKEHCEWVESVGYSANGWIGGDWHTPLHLLSKLLAGELDQRRETVEIDCCDSDVTLKISFDSLLQLAEDTLGVPVLITERDLLTRYPNINLALVTYLVCLRNTIDHIDAKLLRNTQAPRLIFEAKNGQLSSLPLCPECNEHVFIIERVVIERAVYHRQCLKCNECGKLLSRGAYKKTKHGFECISHAVRRILDAHESSYSSGSGTYDRYGYSRSPRPVVAPPPRPKPKPAPKPAYLSAPRTDQVYESLDEIQGTQSQAAHSIASVSASTDSNQDDIVERTVPTENINPFEDSEQKNLHSADNEDTTSTRSNPGSESHSASADETSSGDSMDSGVVMRMAKMFGEVEGGRERTRISQPPVSSPVPPPRPKRTSMLISSTSRSHSASPAPSRSSLKSPGPSTAPKPKLNLEDYPGYLCPFGEEEEAGEAAEYPSGKNPFADSDDESSKGPPVPAPRSHPPPIPVLPGTSDRPKVQPPPPPPGAQVDPSTPPPKPPRSGLNASETRIHTLRISRKKFRAPLPPVPQLRKINFTENSVKEDPAVITKRLKDIEEQMTRIEIDGRAVEKEMLFQIDTNPRTWTKSQRTDDWVNILTKKLELMREQLYLLGLWRENYLNEVHSETEYYIRCLLEKEKKEKSEWELEREATLTNLLIYIIDEKLKLDEYMIDHIGGNSEPKKDESTKANQKKSKLKKRVQMLSKRLKSKKLKENAA
ncbi:hypothetical protein PENTCL1PPCAC_30046 [Pristionchus entomophagus]|uniref:LIM zinc-binding domain-containing protein n=1 Tax=Pristionchus entomophagus TaxID=358040 RepID=A0AAV5UNK1_9BILA|nr:hypothetical protein PENTCL1PPCAC_30046 [Pristionchus entomophagus]